MSLDMGVLLPDKVGVLSTTIVDVSLSTSVFPRVRTRAMAESWGKCVEYMLRRTYAPSGRLIRGGQGKHT